MLKEYQIKTQTQAAYGSSFDRAVKYVEERTDKQKENAEEQRENVSGVRL